MPPPYLPPELWYRIIKELCFHCSHDGIADPVPQRARHRLSPLIALARLCLTSKALNDLATPALYHAPMTKRPDQLLQTLIVRPDLARHVRELHHDEWHFWLNRRELPLPPAFMELYDRNLAHIQEHLEDILLPGGWNPDGLSNSEHLDMNIRDSTIISLLPNLTALHILAKNVIVCVNMPPGALASLTSAAISNWDTMGTAGLEVATHLATAAPNLDSLFFFNAGAYRRYEDEEDEFSLFPFPLFPNVTQLRLQESVIVAESWEGLLAAFPRLTSFAYSGGGATVGYGGSNPRDIQDALVKHKPNLRRLCIDMTSVDFFNDEEDPHDRAFTSSLSELKELEYFAADVGSLLPPETDEGNSSEYLVEMLPASLRCFSLIYMGWGVGRGGIGDLRESLLRLAEVAPDQFPALKRVVMWIERSGSQFDELFDDLRCAWEHAGVEFVVTTRPYLCVSQGRFAAEIPCW